MTDVRERRSLTGSPWHLARSDWASDKSETACQYQYGVSGIADINTQNVTERVSE
jgi:hypothetical protein